MNAKERVLKALDHEEPDRIPSFEGSIDNLRICEYYGEKYAYQGIGKLLKTITLKTEVINKLLGSKAAIKKGIENTSNLFRKVGIDLMGAPLSMFPVKYYKWGYTDEFGRTFKTMKNPSDEMDILFYNGGYFNSFEDYESFEHHPDVNNEARRLNFEAQQEIMEESNHDIFIIPGTGALLEMVWEGFGMENFSRLLARPKHVKKVFDDRGKFALELVKQCIEWGAELILLWDDYAYKSGLFMSPRSFERYIFPWLNRICNHIHKNGGKVILHSCGDILKIFEDLINCGIDAFNPIEPTTANPDYNIFKLKEKYGDKITVIGNVSPQDLAEKETDYIIEYSKNLIKKCGLGGGFIFSSGHSINPAVKLDNFLAMRETLSQYGTYPINVPD